MENINILIVFLSGIISFFSPCIIPILPIYLTILSGSTGKNASSRKGILNTVMFVLGISTAFFILGNTLSVVSNLLIENKIWISLGGGLLIILLGLFYMELIKIPALQKEKRFRISTETMNPLVAYILGFTFSFGWTPCIGPMLAMVFVMTSQSDSILLGNIFIGVYTLGFMIPFLILAFLSNKLSKQFDWIKRYLGEIKTVGGIIMIVAGIIVIAGGVQEINRMQEFTQTVPPTVEDETQAEDENIIKVKSAVLLDEASQQYLIVDENEQEYLIETEEIILVDETRQEYLIIDKSGKEYNILMDEDQEQEVTVFPAYDFTLTDQYGNTHTLSEYKGKVIFLNFWATWCPPCRAEMPDIQEVYEFYGENSEDVIILGVAFPELGDEGSEEEITAFLEEEGYTFPVVFDDTAILSMAYNIRAFPTTYIIDKEGNIEGYVPGAIPQEFMIEIIEGAR